MTGHELRTIRESHRLSVNGLAVQLGVYHTTVWKWETGRVAISEAMESLIGLKLTTVPRYREALTAIATGAKDPAGIATEALQGEK